MLPTDMDLDGSVRSEWKGRTAGGCSNNDTVSDNPQMLLTITRPTEVVLTLTQQDMRVGAGHEPSKRRTSAIGIAVLYGPSLDRVHNRGDMNRYEVATSGKFSHDREVTLKLPLAMRGGGSTTKYVVVPSTFDAGEECAFTVRAFTQTGQPSVELVPGANCHELPARNSVSQVHQFI
jgi:hypothetical protein